MSDAIQLINEQKDYNKESLEYFKRCIDGRDVGFNYHVISVFGSQSSGKSTLLNHLFNTKFDTMDAQVKRQQTTKGIWLAHTREVNNNAGTQETGSDYFILDVEGSDGAERGEDQDFERKAALFAISVSEVLIVNMWEQQVGLYQGNNMGLLKTVFEVNLSLFGKRDNDHKMLLLFVIRDFVGVTPLESLRESLVNELEKIWSDLNKPAGCEDSTIYDFFDLEFTGLAHKLLQEENFFNDMKKLGDSFVIESTDPYYFKSHYHHNLPVDGWNMYAEQCWEQIENNRDLDLPTQQILVARFKTEDIANEAYGKFIETYTEDTKAIIEKREELVSYLKKTKDECIAEYDERASRYAKAVYEEKRIELLAKVDGQLYETSLTYFKKLSEKLLQQLEDEMKDKQSLKTPFEERYDIAFEKIESEFDNNVTEFFSNDVITKVKDIELKFAKDLDLKKCELRDAELANLISRIKKHITARIKEEEIEILTKPSPTLWDDVTDKFDSIISESLKRFQLEDGTYDFKMGLSQENNEKEYQNIRAFAWHILGTIVHDYLKEDTIVSLLRDRFEAKFRYDHNDIPRLWKNEEEIDLSFRIAKEHALEILNVLTIAVKSDGTEVIPDAQDDDAEGDVYYEDDSGVYHSQRFAHILTEAQKEKVLQQFRRQINVTVLDSKRSIITSSTHVPIWVYVLIVVLGWNEFMMIIRNPLGVTFLLISVVSFYFIQRLGLWGHVIRVANTVIGETRTTIKDKLKDFVLEEEHGSRSTASSTSFEMKDLSEKED
ncbi:dynamin-like GTPase SEY1 [Nakaseomyces bracarensis]|uniref:dynamin-like GTPase SEY1 n=1 Tax=Nakaseomyces bracarensis TaxID=273131 RepID=UPI00387155AD